MLRKTALSALPCAILAFSALMITAASQHSNAQTAFSSELPGIAPLKHFEAVNPREPSGDQLESPRRIAAAIVASDNQSPKLVVDVGSFTGEFLEAFMQQFPNAHGQWTEPVDRNLGNAKKRFARFGGNVNFKIGCAARDISLGCVPAGVDVLITSWLSIHQNIDGIAKFYKNAAAMLPPGGWLMNLDHVAYADEAWEKRFKAARQTATDNGLMAVTEGPPVHHADWKVPTLDDQMAAIHAAGFTDVQVVWRRLNTVLIMMRKT